MCGRFGFDIPPKTMEEFFGVPSADEISPNYNITPGTNVNVVMARNNREIRPLRWGLVPGWAKDVKMGSRLINARSETVFEKPSFKKSVAFRRCIVPASVFYEWRRIRGKDNRPYAVAMREGPLALAGIWSHWVKGDQVLDTFAILTTEPNEMMRKIHSRMPVILKREDFDIWLDTDVSDRPTLEKLMHPYPEDQMRSWAISRTVNNPQNNGPEILEANVRPGLL